VGAYFFPFISLGISFQDPNAKNIRIPFTQTTNKPSKLATKALSGKNINTAFPILQTGGFNSWQEKLQ